MSAAEIIEQIKALPPDEQAVVADFVTKTTTSTAGESTVRYMDDATFRAAKERVFEIHQELFRRLAQ